MATMAIILRDVREDIIQRIYQVDPGIKPGIKWDAYESNRPKADDQGHSRSFRIEPTS
ncbi:MAG: hypothetical protein ACYS76_13370 [Planctomycetota bacterium]